MYNPNVLLLMFVKQSFPSSVGCSDCMDVYKAVTHWGSGNVWEPIGTNLGTNLNVVLKAIVFRNILGITFFLSPDFHQLWRIVMSICLLTEVKRQWATLVLGWVTVWVLDQLWDVSELEFLCVTGLS